VAKKTPEGVVKNAVNKVLESYPETYVFMSVPYGYGKSTLDYLLCHYGEFISIETKAPGEVPTPRQDDTIFEIQIARGMNFVIDGVDKCGPLAAYLEQVKINATSPSKPKASARRSAVRGEHQEPLPGRQGDGQRRCTPHPLATPAD
jgi:hypothetical protein